MGASRFSIISDPRGHRYDFSRSRNHVWKCVLLDVPSFLLAFIESADDKNSGKNRRSLCRHIYIFSIFLCFFSPIKGSCKEKKKRKAYFLVYSFYGVLPYSNYIAVYKYIFIIFLKMRVHAFVYYLIILFLCIYSLLPCVWEAVFFFFFRSR